MADFFFDGIQTEIKRRVKEILAKKGIGIPPVFKISAILDKGTIDSNRIKGLVFSARNEEQQLETIKSLESDFNELGGELKTVDDIGELKIVFGFIKELRHKIRERICEIT